MFKPEDIAPALKQAQSLAAEHQVPVVVEMILKHVTNIAMDTEIDAINEFEELAENKADAPTAVTPLSTEPRARLTDHRLTDRQEEPCRNLPRI